MKIIKKKKSSTITKPKLPPWKVLVVDDEPDIHTLTRAAFDELSFAGKSLQMLPAMSGAEAREILKTESGIAVAVIDVVMETDDAGLKLVEFIRNQLNNSLIRLIIRTGQPGAVVEEEVVEHYDINDYKDKSELTTAKLYTTIRLALKSYSDLVALDNSRKAADIANQAKSTFLANMSHELRTPLNGILGYTQILKRDKTLDAKQQDGINVIHRSGEYLLTLINDILDLSKIEADRIELYPTDFHFDDFLHSIVEIFQMRVEQKKFAFIYEKLSHLPAGIHADEKRLRQVIINLLSNAIKFTHEGGINFKVGYHNGKIRFQVEDTGVGIAPEGLDNIFKPFAQEGDQNARAEGTGLGLSITKKLVEMMGGELHVESTLGKGSIFWTTLDLPEVAGFIKPERIEEPIIVGFKGESRKVLVVDDKEANRSVLSNLLAPLGFEIVEAVDGQDSIDKTLQHKPDIILTDLVMPVMDGFEACRRIKRIPEYKDIIVIVISASVFECNKRQSAEAGCDDFLSKPVRADELLKLLEKFLQLTWIYDEQKIIATDENANLISSESEELVGPSVKQAEILFDLAMMGDLKSIIIKLDEFEQIEKKLANFANKIRTFAENFAEEEICDLLEPYLKNK